MLGWLNRYNGYTAGRIPPGFPSSDLYKISAVRVHLYVFLRENSAEIKNNLSRFHRNLLKPIISSFGVCSVHFLREPKTELV